MMCIGESNVGTRLSVFLNGVVPAVLTMFAEDGRVDDDAVAKVATKVIAFTVPAMMCPGYASESYQLSENERQRSTPRALDVAARHGTQPTSSLRPRTRSADTLSWPCESRKRSARVLPWTRSASLPATCGGEQDPYLPEGKRHDEDSVRHRNSGEYPLSSP